MTKIAFICQINKKKQIETCKDNEGEYANRATVTNRRMELTIKQTFVWYFPYKVLIFDQFKEIGWTYLKPKREPDITCRKTEGDNDVGFFNPRPTLTLKLKQMYA